MPSPYLYSSREYGAMLMCLGEALGNATEALRIYRNRHPNARHPSDSRIITNAYQRVLENRPIAPSASGGGHQVDVAVQEQILDVVRREPRLGTRSAARLLRRRHGRAVASHATVHKIIRRNGMRPYKIHRVQALLPVDRDRRKEFCQWLIEQQRQAAGFIEHVVWTDESTFTRNGMWNRRNAHIWAEGNPRASQETGHQVRWSVNVWGGIYNDRILGPVFLPHRMDGASYLDFLNNGLVDIIDRTIPLADYHRMWFQQDGAPPHVSRPVRQRLEELFHDRWIGRMGPNEWPPRSPDLTPLDFFLWGYVKERVFNRPCDSQEEMKRRILDVFRKLREEGGPEMLARVHEETLRRAELCVDLDGAQFEPHLIRGQRN